MRKLIEIIQQRLGLPFKGVSAVVQLLENGASIPFIARYRKEMTGSLDEVAIGQIQEAYQSLQDLIKRKNYILSKIEEQGKLNPKLKSKVENCWDEIELEDIYLPYKKKVKTKASIAREQGLEPLAKRIFHQDHFDIYKAAKSFIQKDVKTDDDALQGARYIIAEWINEDQRSRDTIRYLFKRKATIHAKLIKSKQDEAHKYKDYFDFSESLQRIPSHRLLAILRGENEKLLRLKIGIDQEEAAYKLEKQHIKQRTPASKQIKLVIEDCLNRLLLPSISNEFRKTAKEKADQDAIHVFSENLRQLLLAAPLGEKVIIGVDPGFRTGCKVVCLG
ncbi:MAG: Tex-like N-terminal domain-containing protein, partial [Bacteroidota bacterium]